MKWLSYFLALLTLTACVGQQSSPLVETMPPATDVPTTTPVPSPTPLDTSTPTALPMAEIDRHAYEQATRLGRGVNLGNALEAPKEGEWGVVLEEGYFELIKQAGFDSVRVPIRWNAHAQAEAPYQIDPEFFERVDWVVEQSVSRGLAVILNIHHYTELFDEPRLEKDRFLAIWDQIARHYQYSPDSVYFEILNEPNGTLGTIYWNEYATAAIQTIRQSNPQRTLVVGPSNWNSLWSLAELVLPQDDRNLIATFHYYDPFTFTHQGAEWVGGSEIWLGTKWSGNSVEMDALRNALDLATRWSVKNRRPLFLGEFGAYSKADDQSRHLWTQAVAREAEQRGISWAYWEFCAGFGVYDPQAQAWNEPILSALIP